MDALLAEYLPILIFLGIAVGLSAIIVAASYILARQRPERTVHGDDRSGERAVVQQCRSGPRDDRPATQAGPIAHGQPFGAGA